MAISDAQKEKILKGEGLIKYTELVKKAIQDSADAITTTIIGDATSSGDTLGALEDRIETLEDEIGATGTGLSDRLDAAEDDIDTLEGAVGELDGRLDDLEGSTVGVGAKRLQTASTITAPSGYYISEISQNTNGDVTGVTTIFPTAATTAQGMVTMASGATTSEVYDKTQIDGLIAGVSGDVSGLTTTYKQLQAASTLTVTSGHYITEVTQDAQGVVGITTSVFPTASASTPGMVTMASGATTTEVYDKDQVDEKIAEAAAAAFTAAVTSTIPAVADAEDNTIYFVSDGSDAPNAYNEYLKVNTGTAETPNYVMEMIGSTQLSLDYLSNDDVETIWDETPALPTQS